MAAVRTQINHRVQDERKSQHALPQSPDSEGSSRDGHRGWAQEGVCYPVQSALIQWGLLPLDAVLIEEGDHARRARPCQYGPTRSIPTLHDYGLIFTGPTP